MFIYGLNKSKNEIEEEFSAKFHQAGFERLEEVDGFSHPFMPIILDESPKVITGGSWGLLPFWAKSTGFQNSTLNGNIENVSKNRSYQNYINKRCLVIASHFYLVTKSKDASKFKQRFLVNVAESDLFCFAGLYSMWKDASCNSYKLTYTVLTTKASSWMLQFDEDNKRMPVILNKQDYHLWLNGNSLDDFYTPKTINLNFKKL